MSAIWLMLRELATSKKFIVFVVGLLVTFAAKYGLNLDPEMVQNIIYTIVAYLIGQGIADHGKEAAKIQVTGDLVEAGKTPPEAVKEKLI